MDNHRSPSMRTPRLWAWLLFALAVAGLVVAVLTVKGWYDNQPRPPKRPAKTVLAYVETLPITLAEHPVMIEAGGFVSPKTQVNLAAQVSGQIVRVSPNLQVGLRVKQGEILVQLNPSDYQAALAKAKAGLANAKANLASAKANQSTASANVASAQSSYEQAQAQSRQAKRDVEQLGLPATRLNLKKPQLAAAKAAVKRAKAGLASAKASVASAKAGIDSAKAQVAQAQIQLGRTQISAPFDSVVTRADVAVGEIAVPNKVLATLAGTQTYTVKLTLDSQAMRWVRLGDAVQLRDSVYHVVYDGVLSRFAGEIDPQSRTVGAFVDIAVPRQSNKPLFINSYLRATIRGQVIADSALIPNSALVEGAYVWAKGDDDRIAPVPVTLIYRQSERSLVTFSAPITTLITRPKDSFTAGQRVTTDSHIQPAKGKNRPAGKQPAQSKNKPNKRPAKPAPQRSTEANS